MYCGFPSYSPQMVWAWSLHRRIGNSGRAAEKEGGRSITHLLLWLCLSYTDSPRKARPVDAAGGCCYSEALRTQRPISAVPLLPYMRVFLGFSNLRDWGREVAASSRC